MIRVKFNSKKKIFIAGEESENWNFIDRSESRRLPENRTRSRRRGGSSREKNGKRIRNFEARQSIIRERERVEFSGKGKVVLFGLVRYNKVNCTPFVASKKISEGVESLELFLVNLPPSLDLIYGNCHCERI